MSKASPRGEAASNGAEERTRTFTTLRPPAPQAGASANSATSAWGAGLECPPRVVKPPGLKPRPTFPAVRRLEPPEPVLPEPVSQALASRRPVRPVSPGPDVVRHGPRARNRDRAAP